MLQSGPSYLIMGSASVRSLVIGEIKIALSTAPFTFNATVGDPLRLPCPTITFQDVNEVSNISWYLPRGKTLEHGRFKVRVKKLDNGEYIDSLY